MTKSFSRIFSALLVVGAITLPLSAHGPNTNLSQWQFQSQKLKGKNAMIIDAKGNLALYQGSVIMGGVGTAPSINAGGFYGLKVPFYNVGPNVGAGDVIVSSGTGTGYGTKSTTTASTSVIGVADGTYATGTVGYLTVAGYAVIHTTGTVAIGDVLVSTVATSGYASTNNSPAAATNLGVALSTGAAAGDQVLIRLR